MSQALQKYLAKYQEVAAGRHLNWLQDKLDRVPGYDHGIIVPAYGELDFADGLLHSLMLCSQKGHRRNLVLFLLNAHQESPPEVVQNNSDLAEMLLRKYHPVAEGTTSTLLSLSDHLDLVLLRHDFGEFLLERKRAVGQARKIASDLALALWAKGHLRRDWCFSTDCDALWPTDFFLDHNQNLADREVGFYALPARHDLDARFSAAQKQLGRLYDLHLHSYQKNIKNICPKYGFTPIGGAMAFRYLPYAQVRGFPRLDAAEDFYLANKIAKISNCQQLEGSPISLAPRFSQRVPFGTGVKLQQYANTLLAHEQPSTYSPKCYHALAAVVSSMILALDTLDDPSQGPPALPLFTHSQIRQVLNLGERETHELLAFLQNEGYAARIHDLLQQEDPQRRAIDFWQWFDGLKILRFMNFCHRNLFAPVPIEAV